MASQRDKEEGHMLWAEGRAKSHGQLERAPAANPGVEAAGDRPPGT